MARTITSANSSFVISIPDVFPAPLPVEGYSADDAFTSEAFDIAEVSMGIDGHMSAGYTPNPKRLTVTLQADSASLEIFEAWIAAMESTREVYFAEVTISIPSIGKTYNMRKGVLTNVKKLPDAQKTLRPVPFVITFESIETALISGTI